MEESHYEAMMSQAQAASHLLCHLLTAHRRLAIRKRNVVLTGIFQFLGKSLLFAKRSSESSKDAENKAEKCKEIFQGTFLSLSGSLTEEFNGNLYYQSEWCREEFQVHT